MYICREQRSELNDRPGRLIYSLWDLCGKYLQGKPPGEQDERLRSNNGLRTAPQPSPLRRICLRIFPLAPGTAVYSLAYFFRPLLRPFLKRILNA